MKKQIILGTLSLVASAFLIGCGSDSTTTETQTGYFIDAPVAGLSYKTTSGLTGITDSKGSFQYKKGEKVEFTIGKLSLGEAEPTEKGLVSPRQLTDDKDLEILILRTLQALDIDNNPSNGITIPTSAITDLDEDVALSNLSQDSDILNISTDLAELIDEDYDGIIDVNETEALTHYESSLDNWNNGQRPTDKENQGAHGDGVAFDLSQYPDSNLTQEVKESLAYMGNEERLAYDIYTVLYEYHLDKGTEIKQLANIPTKSEQKHVEIVRSIIQKYDINIDTLTDVVDPVADKDVAFADMPKGKYGIPEIQELYDMLYNKGIESPQAAMEVGCMVEVADVDDLDRFISQAEASNATDIVAAFNVLRDGSYKHYWAFDKGLKNMGITEGCAVLGEDWAKTSEEYPNTRGDSGQGGNGGKRQHGRR